MNSDTDEDWQCSCDLLMTTTCILADENNQHDIAGEISGETLDETSFARAMRLSTGTVSVVDAGGMSWTRIWCGE